MDKPEKYRARARHCMDKADQAKHDDDKQSWLQLAETWMDLIPDRQNDTGSLQPRSTPSMH
jgi:hypothetical protein